MNEETPLLHRFITAELRPSEEDGRTLIGRCVPYEEPASVIDPDGSAYSEMFTRGAFARAVKAPNRVWLRFEHRVGLMEQLGRGQTFEEKDDGLYGTLRVANGSVGDHALSLVTDGMLTGLSVGFRPLDARARAVNGVVVRRRCHLEEVSLVTEPAYAGAGVMEVRAAKPGGHPLRPARNIELDERLRTLGFME